MALERVEALPASSRAKRLLWFDRYSRYPSELELTVKQTFFLSQASGLISVGTGRLATTILLFEALNRQGKWRSASWVGSCLCGLWTLSQAALSVWGYAFDNTEGSSVRPGEVHPPFYEIEMRVNLTVEQASRWLAMTVVDACLDVCLTVAWNILFWRLEIPWVEKLAPSMAFSSRLL